MEIASTARLAGQAAYRVHHARNRFGGQPRAPRNAADAGLPPLSDVDFLQFVQLDFRQFLPILSFIWQGYPIASPTDFVDCIQRPPHSSRDVLQRGTCTPEFLEPLMLVRR